MKLLYALNMPAFKEMVYSALLVSHTSSILSSEVRQEKSRCQRQIAIKVIASPVASS